VEDRYAIRSLLVALLLAAAGVCAQAQQTGDPALAAGRVSAALAAAGEPGAGVVVSTHADTVVLTGDVGSEVDAARVLALAEQAAGDVRVSNQLQVRPAGQQAAQQQALQLVSRVEQALRQDQRTAGLGVAVSIDEAQVIGLHGLVPSSESRRNAEDVAARVAGVTRIRSHLVVPDQ
jgi:osmotically-inducible protein OsmY